MSFNEANKAITGEPYAEAAEIGVLGLPTAK